MSQPRIEKLTPEQETLIPVYREKWRSYAVSTGPINHQNAAIAVKAAYTLIGKKKPYILFCDSPYAAEETLLNVGMFRSLSRLDNENQLEQQLRLRNQLEKSLAPELRSYLVSQLENSFQDIKNELVSQLENQLWLQLRGQLESQLESQLKSQLVNQLYSQLKHLLHSIASSNEVIRPELRVCNGCWLDFCISVLNCHHNFQREWEVLQLLVRNCGWIFPYENICIVCDRPIKLSFDHQQRLHAEGEPAIQFADGHSLYAYHGVILPEKYGAVHPKLWQAQWIIDEDDAGLWSVLIKGIFEARIG